MATKPLKGHITSGYGKRINPITKKSEFHPGIDIAPLSRSNEPVVCAKKGKIAYIDTEGKGSFGKVVYVVMPDKWYAVYPHLQAINKNIHIGDSVEEGVFIGLCGNTGLSAGIHLHYEERNAMGVNSLKRSPDDIIALYNNQN